MIRKTLRPSAPPNSGSLFMIARGAYPTTPDFVNAFVVQPRVRLTDAPAVG